jgi:hypothetical protein
MNLEINVNKYIKKKQPEAQVDYEIMNCAIIFYFDI